MTKKEYEDFIELSYKNGLKAYADYANAKYFNDSSLRVSTKDVDAVFNAVMSKSSNVSKLTYVKRLSSGQKTLLDMTELNTLVRYMQAKLLAQRLGKERYAEMRAREKASSLDLIDLIYDNANKKYIRPDEQQGRKYNNDEKLFADLGIAPLDLAKLNEFGYTIHKSSLQPLTKYKDLSTKGITNVGQFMLYTPQDLLKKGFSNKFVQYLGLCGHTANARDIVAMQGEEVIADLNEMQRAALCREVRERIKTGQIIPPKKASLIGSMLDNDPKVKYDFTPNKANITVDDVIGWIKDMKTYEALTPAAKRKYLEKTFEK